MDAIALLRAALKAGDPRAVDLTKPRDRDNGSVDYPVWRFLHAWRTHPTLALDHAVLLRQVARWSTEPFIGTVPSALLPYFAGANLRLTGAGTLQAAPFSPSWLLDNGIDSETGIDGKPTIRRAHEAIQAESYLSLLGYSEWHSLGAAKK